MRINYLGNFSVPFSTESHVAASLEALGHEVTRIQEGREPTRDVPMQCVGHDLFLWTQTYGLACSVGTNEDRLWMLGALSDAGIPTVGFHLDRWWGLEREQQVYEEAFFRVDYLFTADGAHESEWKDLGINHIWSPPAVFHAETDKGKPNSIFRSEIAFVGSWQHYAHDWPHRMELVDHLRSKWGNRIKFWPDGAAVRGRALQDLYASVKVVVGDSCLVPKKDGSPVTHYCSDRVFETVGRGAYLLHPYVEGITDGSLLTSDKHLGTWELGSWSQLDQLIEQALDEDEARQEVADTGHRYVKENHTYLNRLSRVLEIVSED